jgi:hypothetical protein
MSLVAVGAYYIDTILTSVISIQLRIERGSLTIITEHHITQERMKNYVLLVSLVGEEVTAPTPWRYCSNW